MVTLASTGNQSIQVHLAVEGESASQSRNPLVMITVDESFVSQKSIPHGMALARVLGADTALVRILEAREPNAGLVDPVGWHLLRKRARHHIESLARLQRGHLTTRIGEGRPSEQICHYASESNAGIIVLGARGDGGTNGRELGQTARRVIERAPNSVLLVPAGANDCDPIRYRRVLLPLDGSSRAESALPLALRFAEAEDAEIILIHVVPQPELTEVGPPEAEDVELRKRVVERNERVARAYLRRIRRQFADTGISSKVILIHEGDARYSLPRAIFEQSADLVVMASHGQSGNIDLPMGSVAAHLISQVQVPILLVRNHALAASLGSIAVRNPFPTNQRRFSRAAA